MLPVIGAASSTAPSNPLTLFWLVATILFQVGILGGGCFFGYLYFIPWAKENTKPEIIGEGWHKGYPQNKYIDFLFGAYPSPWRKKYWGPVKWIKPVREIWIPSLDKKFPFIHNKHQRHSLGNLKGRFLGTMTFWAYTIMVWLSSAIVILIITLKLITTKGWLYTISGIPNDFFVQRINDIPNGSHISSYLAVMIFGLTVTLKYRDSLSGALACAFIVAMHEGPWEFLYYVQYSKYLNWQVITSFGEDMSFAGMIILFTVSFIKYKGNPIKIQMFKWPMIAYLVFVVGWFIVPYFYGYGFFPITTINNFQYGHGVYQETVWWGSFLINAIESFSWQLIVIGFTAAVLLDKRVRTP